MSCFFFHFVPLSFVFVYYKLNSVFYHKEEK